MLSYNIFFFFTIYSLGLFIIDKAITFFLFFDVVLGDESDEDMFETS